MNNYDHKKIEKKWQKVWESKKTYQTLPLKKAKANKQKPYYVLDMFPYPSGVGLHVGHPRGYIGSDIFARQKRMQGFNVLHPMGYDAFGLPAEQYAIEHNINPKQAVAKNVATFEKQLSIMGLSYDWSRKVNTTDPKFYKWTQWIFLQIYNSWYDKTKNKARDISELVKIFNKSGNVSVNAVCNDDTQKFSPSAWKSYSEIEQQNILMKYRLAFEGYSEVNWCLKLGTVLANDEIVEKNGKPVSERGGFPVEKKSMRQWFMRITAYADRLLTGLDTLDWSEHIKEIQRNWIGKSEGSEIKFKVVADEKKYLIFDFDGVLGDTWEKTLDANMIITGNNDRSAIIKRTTEYFHKKPGHARGGDEAEIKAGLEFNLKFGDIMKGMNPELFEGFVKEIAKIKDAKVAIVSSGSRAYIDPLVKKMKQLGVHPTHILDYKDHHSKESKMESICRDWGITHKDPYYFTDTKADVYELEKLCDRSKLIGCGWGFLGADVLEEVLPKNQVLRNFSDIHNLFASVAENISVFTTRVDTLFGVTYVVLAPEHALIGELKPSIQNWSAVEKYVAEVKNKSEEDRMASKEKTGVALEGIWAINPANGEHVPVWISDYVLANYGTGAVMAVPAHDERDFEFARKYNLPIKYVVAPHFVDETENSKTRNDVETINRVVAVAIVKHPQEDKYLMLDWKNGWTGFITGGLDEGEDEVDAALREIREETGYKNVRFIKSLGNPNVSSFYAPHKNKNQFVQGRAMYFELVNEEKGNVPEEENKKHTVVWKTKSEVIPFLKKGERFGDCRYSEMFWDALINGERSYTEDGILINSGEFSHVSSEIARKKITEFVGGQLVTKYKMRDAIFARQRYWGEPIPLVHKKDGMIEELPNKKLPLELPSVKSYQPTGTGESPLASVTSWVKSGYETNTMPGWAGSSWYFLRYMDPKNAKAFASKDEMKYWKNVDMYVGGAEHATGHLLYSRFWNKFLYDLGYVPMDEPFKALRNQGMILASNGGKMSKRNPEGVVNPDDIVSAYGADTLRLYEAFMGPFESSIPWSTESIIGSRRFIERVWKLAAKVHIKNSNNSARELLQKTLHKTIKKVTDDIQTFSFNTAISSMMILVNEMDKVESIAEKDFKMFLQILAPFIPHVADELWSSFGEKKSVHISLWPKYDPKRIVEDMVTVGIQVNGKVRAEITLGKDADEKTVREAVLEMPEVTKWFEGKEIKKFIYIKGKIISVVI